MCTGVLCKALAINNEEIQDKITQLQTRLESIPQSFYALFWLYSHDFLYVSPSIEKITGHSLEKYRQHGMVFFQSIIPARLIKPIYESMYAQTGLIENHPDYLMAEEFLHVDAAVLNPEGQEIPVNYNAVLLDTKIFDPPSYLIFCSWIATASLSEEKIKLTGERIKDELLELKKLYSADRPEHFAFLMAGRKLSAREKEVACLLTKGHSSKSIGEQLNISFYTVESHRKNLLEKLQAKNTPELIYKLKSIVA